MYENLYKTYPQLIREQIRLWMRDNSGVMAQLKWCEAHPGEVPVLTEEVLDEFIEALKFKGNIN